MSFYPLPRAAVLTAALLLSVAGCKEPLSPDKKVSTIEVSPKSARLYLIGQEASFSVQLTTEAGTDGAGLPITWTSRNPALVQVSVSGIAKSVAKGGSTYVVATAGGKSDSALVEVPATPCGATPVSSLALGQVMTDLTVNGFCSSSSIGEFTVVVHNSSLAQTGSSSFQITGVGLDEPPLPGPSLSIAPAGGVNAEPFHARRRNFEVEMRDRMNAEAAMAPLAASMRAFYLSRSQRATRDVGTTAVGDFVTYNLNINGSNGCTDPRTEVALRVAAISNTAIVLADPRNPTDGFTDVEYGQFAAMFDSVINPLDVQTFGAPSDLDNNQRVLLVFTRAVNERTPPNVDYFIGGLTHPRDLGSRSSCAGSNQAEMFYLLVPDPLGTINGNKFSKDFVSAQNDATVAHEYQHLINFARRKLILPGAPLPSEELWLNEGLSHLAEELLYYRRSGHTPRTNVGGDVIYANEPQSFDVFASTMSGDFLNFDYYLQNSPTSSPFRSVDDESTRGAAWGFLRYLADQKLSADGQVWYNLVNNPTGLAGVRNLLSAFAVDSAGLRSLLRDFTIAAYADDYVPSVAAKYTLPSWNMRSIYPGLANYPAFDYPQTAVRLRDNQTVSGTVVAGGFKLYRFRGLTSADSYVRLTGPSGGALPSTITMSVIRTK